MNLKKVGTCQSAGFYKIENCSILHNFSQFTIRQRFNLSFSFFPFFELGHVCFLTEFVTNQGHN